MILHNFDGGQLAWHSAAVMLAALGMYLSVRGVGWFYWKCVKEELPDDARFWLEFGLMWIYPAATYAYTFDAGLVPFDSKALVMVMACAFVVAGVMRRVRVQVRKANY